MGVSSKQREMLAFIEDFVGKNGHPPTYEEIRLGLNISTKSLVDYHLGALENAAMLSRSPNTPRGLRVLGEAETVRVPLVGQAVAESAGSGFLNVDDTTEVIELTSDIVSDTDNLCALKVHGNGMIDALVNDGDIIIMQPKARARNGEVVVVRLIEQNQTTLKRFYRENGHVRLQPVNPTMKPLLLNPKSVKVQGKVVAIIRQVS